MRLFNHHFLRIFVALLVTMLSANTVYAGGMMVSAALAQTQQIDSSNQSQGAQEIQNTLHNHDAQHAHQHEYAGLSNHALEHKPTSHGGCKHCNHCLACSSMMPNLVTIVIENANNPVLLTSLTPLYLSPISPQLQRPPIA